MAPPLDAGRRHAAARLQHQGTHGPAAVQANANLTAKAGPAAASRAARSSRPSPWPSRGPTTRPRAARPRRFAAVEDLAGRARRRPRRPRRRVRGLATPPPSRSPSLLIAERDENTCRKDLAPSEAIALGAAIEAIESKAAKARQAAAGPITGKGKKRSGVAKLTTPMKGRANAKVATAVGMKRTTYEKAKAVVQAAKDDPKRFGPLLADMDRTGKVDRAYSKVRRAGKINAAQAPTGKYRVLYADPPWHRGGGTGTLPEDATRRV